MMRMPRLILADEVTASAGSAGAVIDLAEYAYPSIRAAVWDDLILSHTDGTDGPLAVIVPADADTSDLRWAVRTGATLVVVNDAESAAQLQRTGAALDDHGATTGLVARITSGRGLYAAPELAGAHRRVAGLWYAVADLVVDFDDEPPMPYYFDGGESRLAAPAWTRSRLLTVARAAGIALWGQLDLTFAGAPPAHERRHAVQLARLSGFDVLVTRHPLAEREVFPSPARREQRR